MTGPEFYRQRLTPLIEGSTPEKIAHLKSGYAVMGDTQFLPGYCLLLAFPYHEHLNEMPWDERMGFLTDVSLLGDAVLAATGAKRINYSIYGNQDKFVHAHVWPRYEDEDPAFAAKPPFLIPAELRESTEHRFDAAKHDELRQKIRRYLLTHLEEAGRSL